VGIWTEPRRCCRRTIEGFINNEVASELTNMKKRARVHLFANALLHPFRPSNRLISIRPLNLVGRVFDFLGYVAGTIAFIALAAGVAGSRLMLEQMKVVGDTLVESAAASFGVGLLTTVLAMVIGFVLVITICLAFIPPIAFILLGIATLFGWIVAGQLIGERLMIASGRPYPNLVVSTVVGVMVLTFVAKMPVIELVPCLGWMLGAGVVLGIAVANAGYAVILTWDATLPSISVVHARLQPVARPRAGTRGSPAPAQVQALPPGSIRSRTAG
jgi:hypothetical protein